MQAHFLFALISCLSILVPCVAQNLEYSTTLEETIDSHLRQPLLTSLNALVKQIENQNIDDSLLWKHESEFSRDVFEDVYNHVRLDQDTTSVIHNALLNSYPIGKGRYLNQISYHKQNEESGKSLLLVLVVIAHQVEDQLRFSTPISYYAKAWNQASLGSITYFYRDKIDLGNARAFDQKNIVFADRFGVGPRELKLFMAENYQEILRLLGFDYSVKNIGQLRDGYGVVGGNVIFSVMDNEDFSHDLFHYYSESIHDWAVRNWVAEEGLAYSWGNAYYTSKQGEMIEQKEMLEGLKAYLDQNSEVDLLQLFENNFWTDKSGIYQHIAPDISVGRLIASLICDEVDQEHGMDGIEQLLTCGSKPNHVTPFLEIVDQLVDINRSNFNEKVSSLINR